jgi:anti-sigma-K factor RskA
MSSRRENRALRPRSDRQILADDYIMGLLRAVEARQVSRASRSAAAAFLLGDMPVMMKNLAREDLVYAPISGSPTLATRGARLLSVARGELPLPQVD